jgi:hypothetical protein
MYVDSEKNAAFDRDALAAGEVRDRAFDLLSPVPANPMRAVLARPIDSTVASQVHDPSKHGFV